MKEGVTCATALRNGISCNGIWREIRGQSNKTRIVKSGGKTAIALVQENCPFAQSNKRITLVPTFINSDSGWPMPPAAPSTATLRSGTLLAKPRAPAARTTSLVARASACIVAAIGKQHSGRVILSAAHASRWVAGHRLRRPCCVGGPTSLLGQRSQTPAQPVRSSMSIADALAGLFHGRWRAPKPQPEKAAHKVIDEHIGRGSTPASELLGQFLLLDAVYAHKHSTGTLSPVPHLSR